MTRPFCDTPDAVFLPGYYHCEACVLEEAAYRAREAASEAAFLAEAVARNGLTEAQLEAAEAAADADYDQTVNR
jgi:hypothetical protein